MITSLSQRFNSCALLLFAVVIVCGDVQAQTSFELQELNTTLQVAAQKIQAYEAQLAASKDKNAALTQSAAASNNEALELKDRYERLRGLLEGLGITALENAPEQTQARLLSSLSDLRIAETSRLNLADSLMELAEASLQFVKTVPTPEPTSANRLQTALVKAEETLAKSSSKIVDPTQPAADLQDARIVSLKSELGIAVLRVALWFRN
jgi:chromosome segregation ATPase